MISSYQLKPVKVTAIQWRGDNKDEVISFLEGCSYILYSHIKEQISISIFSEYGQKKVNLKDYIIKDENNNLFREHEKVFKKKYELIN